MSNPIIQIQDLCFSRGNKPILSHLNLSVSRGECVAILGPNGAGKSTFIDLLLGRLAPSSGNIQVLGAAPSHRKNKDKLGVMLQTATLPGNTLVKEFIQLFRSYYQNPISHAQALQYSGLQEAQHQRFSELSGGQKQRLLFTLAVLGNPELIFLDEPSLAMDALMRREMWSLIHALKQAGKTIILTTHYLEEADALADKLVILKQGQFIATGSPQELKHQNHSVAVHFTTTTPANIVASILDNVDFNIHEHQVQFQHESPELILKKLFLAGIDIQSLHVTQKSLEETFLQLTEERAA